MSVPPRELDRRHFMGLSASAAAFACGSTGGLGTEPDRSLMTDAPRTEGRPVLVGSRNGLPGMQAAYPRLLAGAPPLEVAIDVVKVVEADPEDRSVGLGGLPNEDGVVQLDAAVMDGATHNSGAVAAIENILHPSVVARLVMERTDHCMIVGRGAYDFARAHGHDHIELLTPKTRRIWLRWKETMSDRDDRLPPPAAEESEQASRSVEEAEFLAQADAILAERPTGTIHCSALSTTGEVACTTTTSGLSWKIPGRVGDSPIIGAGLYCDAEAGSAGATGRGEAAILSGGSHAAVELLRSGMSALEAGLEVLRRVTRQARRAAAWQPGLVDEHGLPAFGLNFYVLGLDGETAGVTLRGGGEYAVADPEGGVRLEQLVALHDA